MMCGDFSSIGQASSFSMSWPSAYRGADSFEMLKYQHMLKYQQRPGVPQERVLKNQHNLRNRRARVKQRAKKTALSEWRMSLTPTKNHSAASSNSSITVSSGPGCSQPGRRSRKR
ncbi:MAG: hypothetical protein ACI8P0_004676 [Planctomycetaceae bacterium]|jgi:hypothetical protein